jgi:CubicO group peptidase (beta-lactamase class C family)
MKKLLLVTLAALVFGCSTAPIPVKGSSERDIARFVDTVLRDIPEVPSLGIAVVRDGRTVYLREPGTPYYIGSTTKAYTGLACAILAQRGQLDLDASISRYLPEVTAPNAPTIRAFLTHTSGWANNPVVFRTAFTGEHTPSQLVTLLNSSKTIKPGFRYDNLGYVVASLIIERVTGKPWQKALDELVFTPLGMDHTTAYMSEAQQWSMPKAYIPNRKGTLDELHYIKNDQMMHAAGGIVTTPSDLARWLNTNLMKEGGGIPRAAFEEAQRLQTATTADRGDLKSRGYGFGWYQADFRGENALQHGGGFPGWQSFFTLLPDRRMGVGVMTNASGPSNRVLMAVTSFIYDVLLEKSPDAAERAAALKADIDKGRGAAMADIEKRSKRTWQLKHPNAVYVGRYDNPSFGTVSITEEGGQLYATLANLRSVLEAFTEPETARVEMVPGNGEVLRFKFDEGAEKPRSFQWGDDVFTRIE